MAGSLLLATGGAPAAELGIRAAVSADFSSGARPRPVSRLQRRGLQLRVQFFELGDVDARLRSDRAAWSRTFAFYSCKPQSPR